jgi:hypothetical protein
VKTLGLVGGLGPESTIDYYRRILDACAQANPSGAPAIVIDSLDVRCALHLVDQNRPGLIQYLLTSLRRLTSAGVDFVAITPIRRTSCSRSWPRDRRFRSSASSRSAPRKGNAATSVL